MEKFERRHLFPWRKFIVLLWHGGSFVNAVGRCGRATGTFDLCGRVNFHNIWGKRLSTENQVIVSLVTVTRGKIQRFYTALRSLIVALKCRLVSVCTHPPCMHTHTDHPPTHTHRIYSQHRRITIVLGFQLKYYKNAAHNSQPRKQSDNTKLPVYFSNPLIW